METTRLSSKGQVIIPKAVRHAKGWAEGTEFIINSSIPDMISLKRKNPFSPCTLHELVNFLDYKGPPKTLQEMDHAVLEEARLRWKKQSE